MYVVGAHPVRVRTGSEGKLFQGVQEMGTEHGQTLGKCRELADEGGKGDGVHLEGEIQERFLAGSGTEMGHEGRGRGKQTLRLTE